MVFYLVFASRSHWHRISYPRYGTTIANSMASGIPGEYQRGFSNESTNLPPGIDLILSRLDKMDKEISSLKAELRQTRSTSGSGAILQASSASDSVSPYMKERPTIGKSPGKHFVEDATGATIFLGSHSDPPVALGCRQPEDDSMINDTMLLDQLVPRAYPFTNLWKPEPGAGEICETLPDDSDIIRYVLLLLNTPHRLNHSHYCWDFIWIIY